MWYEILPSFGIIFAAMCVPHYGAYVINKLALGNPYRRRLESPNQRLTYIRDRRLTGNVYNVAGLDAIPDN
ncbi:NADH-ubiquinone oxidoreductase MWFE subunit [Popillia japonica]|uniref:NADH dehydrogenase [ubiquinone] 1 alpha subcomplex subunit 1 n=1 Tax=Popillia japonica TaxID=7064 RepID=A0AAW1KJ51_POPJA